MKEEDLYLLIVTNDPIAYQFISERVKNTIIKDLVASKDGTPENAVIVLQYLYSILKDEVIRKGVFSYDMLDTIVSVYKPYSNMLIELRSQDRLRKLKDLSKKLKMPREIKKTKKQPAYLRRKVEHKELESEDEGIIFNRFLNQPFHEDLNLFIDLGKNNFEALADILSDISILYRMQEGSGIRFSLNQVIISKEEHEKV